MCEDASEAFCEWRGRNERGGLAGSVFIHPVQPHTVVTRERSVQRSHLLTHILSSHVSIVFTCFTHILSSCVSVVFSVPILFTHMLSHA